MFPVLHYKQISQLDLYDRYYETLDKLYHWESIRKRAHALFRKGYFTREYRSDQNGFFFKFKMTFVLIYLYLLRPGMAKRKLFLDLIGLIKQRKITIESAAIFLISMEGFRRHLRMLKKHLPEFRAEIKNVDKGPWQEQIQA